MEWRWGSEEEDRKKESGDKEEGSKNGSEKIQEKWTLLSAFYQISGFMFLFYFIFILFELIFSFL